MFSIALLIVTIGVLYAIWLLRRLNRDYVVLALCKRFKTANGCPIEDVVAIAESKTIFGNSFDMISMNAEELFYYSRSRAEQYRRSYIEYILGSPSYNVIDAEDVELVLTDPTLIRKGIVYKFLQPFLKEGLLVSADRKWHQRRKMLTPAFHFNILNQFSQIFMQESEKFVKSLYAQLDNAGSDGVIISLGKQIPRFTLNNVCETALGVRLDECHDGDEYRENLEMVEKSFVQRVTNPLLMSDMMYNLFSNGKSDMKYLRKLHDFTSGIIERRRKMFAKEIQNNDNHGNDEEEFNFKKRRYAMLDTLLHAEREGLINHAGICEEVDTFVFEGFDTTSMNLMFALMNFALYPAEQKRCVDEIKAVISDNDDFDIAKLNELKYLDCFVKETQRLYPSVPFMMRQTVKETVLANNLILPNNSQIAIHVFDIQRNPKYWDSPDEFKPERFLPENSVGRHPFAFVPFSAGQRNCIGQKFAMLEIKTLLVNVLKNFELLPITRPESFRFLAGILIRSQNDIEIKIKKRQ